MVIRRQDIPKHIKKASQIRQRYYWPGCAPEPEVRNLSLNDGHKTGSSVSWVNGENSHGHFVRIIRGNRPRESTYSHRVGLFYKLAFALPNMEAETIVRTIMENHSDKVASLKANYV